MPALVPSLDCASHTTPAAVALAATGLPHAAVVALSHSLTLASLALAVRFTMVVQAGAIGADALTGKLSLASTALMLVAAAATAGLAWISSVHLRIHIRQAKV
jgi:hypothetical protein